MCFSNRDIWDSLFQFYIACMSVHSLIMSGRQFVSCIDSEWRDCSSYSPPTTVILLVFLVFEALLFAIFTAAMLFSQLQAIWNDETVSKHCRYSKYVQNVISNWTIFFLIDFYVLLFCVLFQLFTTPPTTYYKNNFFLNYKFGNVVNLNCNFTQ